MNGKERRRYLRQGWTTGTCATAAARAAFEALSTGRFPDPVSITLPKGLIASFPLSRRELTCDFALAGVIKDAGDDPDVTHGAEIIAEVRRLPPGSGVCFRAGQGVGSVTRPGLPLPPGEPAINPHPRRMMIDAVGGADLEITISIPGGERLAEKTLNARLGIVGGLSILGTTGIVVPYSCSAWVGAIKSGLDVARAAGISHIAACTGRTSEAGVAVLHGLPEVAMIDMGNFAGALLKLVKRRPFPRLTIAGGPAKLAKLARGENDLHSRQATADLAWLTEMLTDLGADAPTVLAARRAGSVGEIMALAENSGLPLGDRLAHAAWHLARKRLSGDTGVDIAIFDRQGELIGHAGP